MFPENLTPGENKGIATLTPLNAIDTHSRPFNFANPQKNQTIFVWTTILRFECWHYSRTFSIAYVEINVIHCGTWPYHRKGIFAPYNCHACMHKNVDK